MIQLTFVIFHLAASGDGVLGFLFAEVILIVEIESRDLSFFLSYDDVKHHVLKYSYFELIFHFN